MSKRIPDEEIQIRTKEIELLERVQECRFLFIDCAKVNNFTPQEASIAVRDMFISFIIFSKQEKEKIEEVLDEMKKVIFKELNY